MRLILSSHDNVKDALFNGLKKVRSNVRITYQGRRLNHRHLNRSMYFNHRRNHLTLDDFVDV